MQTETARGNVALVAFMAVVAIASCATDGPAPAPSPAEKELAAAPKLEDTYWKLVSLDGQVVASGRKDPREPHIRLHRYQNRLTASGGCNGMSGSYELEADRLSFGDVLGTRMACVDRMDQESRFTAMLSRVARWRIAEGRLELLDTGGAALAQFTSRDTAE